MTKITNEAQYYWALNRVEELLPLVKDETPRTAPESIELELLSNLVADYSDEHFSIIEDPNSDKLNVQVLVGSHIQSEIHPATTNI